MMKIAIPVLLVSIVMIAGIFAFMPIDKATTVHTTIQGSQLNSIASDFTTDTSINVTATCGGTAGFLVYYTFTNGTGQTEDDALATLNIDDLSAGNTDIAVTLALGNQTSTSGVIGGTSAETITFSGANFEDVGSLAVTVQCQSGSSPSVTVT